LVAVFPQTESTAATYLTSKGVKADKVVSEPLDRIMVEGTPTVYVVGSDGKVEDVWIGFLNEARQKAALTNLLSILES
jgi:uncharacterized membrane protein